MIMKKLLFIILLLLSSEFVIPQTELTLEDCYEKARINYPLIKQKEYIDKSKDYSVSNVWKGYFPQITISGQATYQTDVTALQISLPGVKIESLTKDQYKAAADVSQVIYDGGVMSAHSDIQKFNAEVDDQKVEIELLKVKDRINQIYFGILLLNEQLIQTDLIKSDLTSSLDKMNAAFANGMATKPNVEILKAELLKVIQREIELKSSRRSFTDMLGLLINQRLEESQILELPIIQNFSASEVISRPELNLYASQEQLINHQGGLTLAKNLPKVGLFFQGGYGKPTLNMLENNFDWYYIAGHAVNLDAI